MKPTTDIVEELRLYNRWRRGDEAITAPDPTALGKLLDDAADRIEHLFASGIHTCHADCQRPVCVLRREQAKAHADLLLSTGMAYEITPHTIAYRSFLDGYAAGAASSPEAKRLNWALDHPEKFHDLASDFMRRYTADAEANARMIADEIDEAMKLDTYP